jgi:DNA-binding beta-propeller fold protein YncE
MRGKSTTACFLAIALAAWTHLAPAQPDHGPGPTPTPTLVVACDLACNWQLDGQPMGSLAAGESRTVTVSSGQHLVAAVTADGLDKVEKQVGIGTAAQAISVPLDLQAARNARYSAARLQLRRPARAPRIVVRIAVPANAANALDVNPRLNKIYVSGGASADQQVAEIDGATWALAVLGLGSGASVDPATNHVWAAGVYDGSVLVYDGVTRKLLQTIPLSGCPVGTAYDAQNARAWVGAQCGANDDPTFAVNGRTYQVETNPIGSGGVYWGNPIANPRTGKAYLGSTAGSDPPVSLAIDPAHGFVQTANTFGNVGAVDAVHNLLFAIPSGGSAQLQIISGGPGPKSILLTVTLPFAASAGALAVNPASRRLYVANGAGNSIEVLNETTGASLGTIPLGAGNAPGRLAADPARHLLYALVQTANGAQLFVLQVPGA